MLLRLWSVLAMAALPASWPVALELARRSVRGPPPPNYPFRHLIPAITEQIWLSVDLIRYLSFAANTCAVPIQLSVSFPKSRPLFYWVLTGSGSRPEPRK